jgi:hypothetical protein
MAKDYNPSRRNREAFEALAETPGNVPPQAVELEEAVLGALMLEKDSIIAVQEYVTPDAFYTEEHRTIYKAIEELSMELKPIDLYTVTERLKGKKELKKVGGASYLAQLTQKDDLDGAVLIAASDMPLLDTDTLDQLLAFHEKSGNGATVLTTILDDPTGYGRIIRDSEGNLLNRIEGIDVPIVRGKLTTIRDEFLTRDYAPGIGIDPGFDGDINITIPD